MDKDNYKSHAFRVPFQVIRKTYIESIQSENSYLKSVIENSLVYIDAIQQGRTDFFRNPTLQSHRLLDQLLDLNKKLAQQRQEEQEQKWINHGITRFIDILQKENHNLDKLTDQVIAELVRYMEINQGGIFVATQEAGTTYLDMLSCYAYERKKHLQKRIVPGEGLLGQAFLERQTVYLTQLPPDYIKITSGLGEVSPRSLLIIPLIVKHEVMGAVELASLEIIPPYKINFAEKLAEHLASVISSVRINEQTSGLLKEFQQYSEELNAQSEEMRQNLEELQSIQEELARKSKEIERLRETEKERSEKQLDSQKKIMEKVNRNFQTKEEHYKKRIEDLESLLHYSKHSGSRTAL
jgi:methyl-accepting chemotaxis protein